ncbi:phenylalanine--tRNA ligase subunit beta [Neoehrlichia mikurensis]|uniref:Phenylalanine--tRNA ligase beta subunit n=1 Tax=Neoehrlichia mikurensis TaxID=89586 RepID=A0A9Q9BV07_9RICK|nr:phenylalanine--tRNA ligase subunit beta [Neoehrlichia mikurensis]QXK91814.1 phenylalanine--tRNA ligase subunit beta [Neoehrlichia mikurensis]QXK93027.1 phenylalanine--tRNA ligase subunit beta [Neoehrlichia mikurensis]QXK93505.1 phenylalanine--tRNA ligase subunit beta [Neoehrlichia mikurensis]UTO55541.1 phenylalanine--tRNA ligase subunit beta [Neoehrlichia mikurensis]UTO56462.1 phenylalanine--tRNA ligase subunit beta [Neoehrlichia mikurensis]
MKFALSWLLKYLDSFDVKLPLNVIVDKLNDIGLEVKVINNASLQYFVVVEVLEINQHPDALKLQVCKVSNGKEIIQVVCGASNLKIGMRTVLASIGSVIPKGQSVIDYVKLRGIDSYGMLCSKEELNLLGKGEISEGIIELSNEYNVGEKFFLCEPIIEVGVTPNRGDCLGIYGISRELSAAQLGKLRPINSIKISSTNKSYIKVNMQVKGIFMGRYISGIKNCESPKWLKDYLISSGIKPISYVVDITNYVMLTFNRPLHVYDADKIYGNNIVIKRSNEEIENFCALNGKYYNLNKDNIIITDGHNNIHGIAGVIGSEFSKCTMETENIFLESAWFDPIDIALSSKRINLSTDASYRFERFIDPNFVKFGLDYATQMIVEYCGGIVSDFVVDQNYQHKNISFVWNPQSVKQVGNVSIEESKIFEILIDLGFSIDKSKGDDKWVVTSPSWRSDINHSSDLVEEVLRIYGYDKIQEQPIVMSHVNFYYDDYDKLRVVMAVEGLTEVLTLSFISKSIAEKFAYKGFSMLIGNPINNNFNLMRPFIVSNLLQIAAENQSYGCDSLSIFEIGKIYTIDGEYHIISGLRYGNNLPRNLYGATRYFDFFDAKSDVLCIFLQLGIQANDLVFKNCNKCYLHPVKSANLYFQDVFCGYFGEVHPNFVDMFKIKYPVVCFEIFLDKIPKVRKLIDKFTNSKYQVVKRDFAFLVSKDLRVQDLIEVIKDSNKQLISDVSVFDIYKGNNIPEDKVSVALSVILTPVYCTLTEQEIKDVSNCIVNYVKSRLGGILRLDYS